MAHHSAGEVYQLVVNSSFSGQLAPMIEELRAAGAFSAVLADLIDKLQTDDAFRKSLLRGDTAIKIGRRHQLPASELLALEIAATLLVPGEDLPKHQLSTTVSPSAYELSKGFRDQTADFSAIRQPEVEPMIQAILQSREEAQQIAGNPCLCLGTGDYNRAEFVFLYLLAAVTSAERKWWKVKAQVNISTDFLMASNLSSGEAQHLAESLWQMIGNLRPKGASADT